jgi:23S rRNA (cytidine1920-2'-O)/16S rRNA (cytidine1409-2'-O)-methyltransferase
MERTNFRYVKPEDLIEGLPQFASIDVSFISLRLILPVLKTLLVPSSDVVALIKPQFEAGREQVGKKGIVRDPKVHEQVIEMMIDFALRQGYDIKALTFSPITGGDGNIEFLIHLHWEGSKEIGNSELNRLPLDIVNEAHSELKKVK